MFSKLTVATTAIVIPGIVFFSVSDSDSWSSFKDAAVSQVHQLIAAPASKGEPLYFPFVANLTQVDIDNGKWGYEKQPGETFFAHEFGNQVLAISPENKVRIVAGKGDYGFKNGHVKKAKFLRVQGTIEGPDGTIYMADSWAHHVRIIRPGTNLVKTLAGGPGGKQKNSGFVNGPASEALFHKPHGLLLDGNLLYVADTLNHAIRVIDLGHPELMVSTLAGNGTAAFTVDGPIDANTTFMEPHGMALGRDGTLYVGDTEGHKVLKISPDRKHISTVAGSSEEGLRDGLGADARLAFPTDVIVDEHENLIVSDMMNYCVRAITPSGYVHTLPATGEPNEWANPDVEAKAGMIHRMYAGANGSIYAYNLFTGREGTLSHLDQLTLTPTCYDDETEYEGNDLKPEPLTRVKSPNECQWICQATAKCEAFTYDHSQSNCTLKTKMTESGKSASKTTSGPRSCTGYTRKEKSVPMTPSLFMVIGTFMAIVFLLALAAFVVKSRTKRVHIVNDAHKHKAPKEGAVSRSCPDVTEQTSSPRVTESKKED